jgi:hypothetical protein
MRPEGCSNSPMGGRLGLARRYLGVLVEEERKLGVTRSGIVLVRFWVGWRGSGGEVVA